MTPRRIRLIRAATLPALQASVAELCRPGDITRLRDTLVVVPSRAAAGQLRLALERGAFEAQPPAPVLLLPDLLTRDDLYRQLHARLDLPAPLLSTLEREVLLGASARAAIESGAVPPFRMRPALVAEMLQFYDQLARQQRTLDDFERLVKGDLEPRAEYDRGAARLLSQTQFLLAAFRTFDARVAETGSLDEHALRQLALETPCRRPYRHAVVTVGDRAVDPAGGLFPADWDLLTRIPGLETVDVISTQVVLASGWHDRVLTLLPGIEEVDAEPVLRAPTLEVPASTDGRRVFTSRDREEELRDVVRRIKVDAREAEGRGERPALDHAAVVFKRPLPYVYLARTVLEGAGVEFQASDSLPLAAEPFAAALALVFETVGARFNRPSLLALMRSPHFRFSAEGEEVTLEQLASFDSALAEASYLGDPARLASLVETWSGPKKQAGAAACAAVSELLPLTRRAAVSQHVTALVAFVRAHERLPEESEALLARHLRARSAILAALEAVREAATRFDDPVGAFFDVAASLKRWIQSQTFSPRLGHGGVHLVDAAAARYGDFDQVHLAGLVEGDWPESRGTNIFYPSFLLAQLGWPTEATRAAGERAAFADLLRLARARVSLSAFTLEDDSLVELSPLVDELDRAGLATTVREMPTDLVFLDEALIHSGSSAVALPGSAGSWFGLREARTPPTDQAYHGTAAPAPVPVYSVTAIDRYLDCPFKYFAVKVLKLPEEPTDEEGLTPIERGQFVHDVFQAFFEQWQAKGYGAVTLENIDEARRLFAEVAATRLDRLSPADATLERVRVLGSVAAPGLGETVLISELNRPDPIRRRLLEYQFEGEFLIDGGERQRRVRLRGVVDRADLLADGRLRIVDYKIGRAPESRRTVQLPIYMACLPQYLARQGLGQWTPSEAFYLAFGESDPERTVLGPKVDIAEVMRTDQERLLAAIDGIERGEFPPRPSSARRCGTCAYADVCRKDYVGAD